MKDWRFCKQLKTLREAKNLTHDAIAKQTGLDSRAVRHYEDGTRTPGLASIKALCEVLECTATELVGI